MFALLRQLKRGGGSSQVPGALPADSLTPGPWSENGRPKPKVTWAGRRSVACLWHYARKPSTRPAASSEIEVFRSCLLFRQEQVEHELQ